ncbi:MAG: hypothetical protein DWQ06_00550 [Calditrichaeota bacterium]|nr:MAG: hypothetical protein DWQ06_00550 [Calditrichota bacterium]
MENPDFDIETLVNNFSIGLPLSQRNIFDHRFTKSPLIYSDFTDSDGRFQISEIRKGQYNLVITKEGFGKLYELDFEIKSSKNIDFTILPDDTLGNEINDNVILVSGKNYFVSDVITIEENASLTIPEGCQIKLAKNSKIKVFGELKILGTENNPVEFFSENPDENWNELKFQTDAVSEINYLIASSFLSITYDKAEVNIANSVFRNANGSFELNGISLGIIENCLIYENLDNTSIFQIQSGVDNLVLRNNIISNSSNIGTSDCINLAGTSSSMLEVENNVFMNSRNGVTINGGNEVVINKNFFYNLNENENGSSYALRVNGNTKMIIQNNNFLKNSMNVYFTFDGSSKDGQSFSLNNFFDSDELKWNIFLDSGLHEGTVYGLNDILLSSNYWGNSGPSLIRDGKTPNSYPNTGIVIPEMISSVQISNGAPLISN